MVVVPSEIPVTTPVVEPTVPIAVLLLLHVPPGNELDSVVVDPKHAINIPVIAPGVGVTVTIAKELQPATVYNIDAVPGVIPVTTPVVGVTVATPVARLLQVPPPLELANVVVYPAQTDMGPVMDATAGFTVIVLVAKLVHPKPFVTVTV